MKKLYVSVLALFLVLVAVQVFAAPAYTVTDLGSLDWAADTPQPGSQPNTTQYAKTSAGEVGARSTFDPNTAATTTHAYLYRGGTLTDLGVLPGAMGYTNPPSSVAMALNSADHVVGSSQSAFYRTSVSQPAAHAVLWGGSPIDLGTIQGNPNHESMAEGISDSDEIVGWSDVILTTGQGARRAFLWVAGKMYSLSFILSNSRTTVLTDASAINCQGQIAAVGFDTRDPTHQHSYLLTRVGPVRTTCH